ncbi:MAG: glycoside hydrolase, partial [Oscillospiraceae bacterium]|nr:glycoside hydrolase [Oscillospiraceae bacterium]
MANPSTDPTVKPTATASPAPTKTPSSSPTDIKGDVDFDGKITVADLVALKSGIINGFSGDAAKSNGDVDKSKETNAEDALYLQKYLLGTLTEFPDNTPAEPEPVKSNYSYNSAISYKEAPGDYFNPCSQAGKVTTETYNSINGSNTCLVYTPYGYDSSKKYNILYLMHGGGENEKTIFYDDSTKMANMFDHMIMNGELEPLTIVCPTFN